MGGGYWALWNPTQRKFVKMASADACLNMGSAKLTSRPPQQNASPRFRERLQRIRPPEWHEWGDFRAATKDRDCACAGRPYMLCALFSASLGSIILHSASSIARILESTFPSQKHSFARVVAHQVTVQLRAGRASLGFFSHMRVFFAVFSGVAARALFSCSPKRDVVQSSYDGVSAT